MIISIEGIDYAGKTTQVRLLYRWLNARRLRTKVFKSPDMNSPTGRVLSRYLNGKLHLSDGSLLALFAANRLEMKPKIMSSMATHDIILCDRYSESAYAYGQAKGLPKEWLISLESLMPIADIVFLLDIAPSITLLRHNDQRPTDIIEENLNLQERVRNCYLSVAQESVRSNQRWTIINGEAPIEQIQAEINRVVQDLLL